MLLQLCERYAFQARKILKPLVSDGLCSESVMHEGLDC